MNTTSIILKFIDTAKGGYKYLKNRAMKWHSGIVEKLKWAKDTAFSDEHNNYFTAIAFVPFIGWLIPLYLKPENEFCQRQAKRAFYLAMIFLGVLAVLLFAGIFFSRDWRMGRFIHAIAIYLVEFIYFGFCIYGIRMSILNKEAEIIDKFPLVKQLSTIIEL
ncbi:MAG: hypothetical protein N2316_10755 [Spirochaetes bacterium]|nr:hypothetical protein [Spirochaetota bacterium]